MNNTRVCPYCGTEETDGPPHGRGVTAFLITVDEDAVFAQCQCDQCGQLWLEIWPHHDLDIFPELHPFCSLVLLTIEELEELYF